MVCVCPQGQGQGWVAWPDLWGYGEQMERFVRGPSKSFTKRQKDLVKFSDGHRAKGGRSTSRCSLIRAARCLALFAPVMSTDARVCWGSPGLALLIVSLRSM